MSLIRTPRGIPREWVRFTPDLRYIASGFRDLGFAFSVEDPIEVAAWVDQRGKTRRIEAVYENGGWASLRINHRGHGYLDQGLNVRMTATKADLSHG